MKTSSLIVACVFTIAGMAIGAFTVILWPDWPASQRSGESASVDNPLTANHETAEQAALVSNNPFALKTVPDRTGGAGTGSDSDAAVTGAAHDKAPRIPSRSAASHYRLYDYHNMLALLMRIDTADVNWLRGTAPGLLSIGSNFNSANVVALSAVIQRWAAIAPDNALDWIESMHAQGRFQHPYLNEVFLGIASSDGNLIESWIEQTVDEELGYAMRSSRYQSLASSNPIDTLEQLAQDPGMEQYAYNAISQWASTDPQAAYDWLNSSAPEPLRTMLGDSVMEIWMQSDPQAAIQAVDNMTDPTGKSYLISRYVGELAQSDPEAAFDYAINLPDEQARIAALSEAINYWSYADSAGLQQRIAALSDTAMLQQVLQISAPQIVDAIAQQSPESAIEWASSLPADARDDALAAAFDQWFYQQPDQAIDWLRQQEGDNNTTRRMQQTALWTIPQVNLDYALDVFDTLGRNEQESITATMVYQLQEMQPDALQPWLDSIDHPDVRRLAQNAAANLPIVANPDQALQELLYLSGEQKIDRLVDIVSVLSVTAPESVQQFLAQYPLSTSEQARVELKLSEDMNQFNACGPMNYSMYELLSPQFH